MVEKGILKNYDAINHRASIQLVGSLTTYFDNLKVARNIAADQMVIGRHVFIAIPDNNPGNATIIAVFDP
ncbi:MAG: hypothetical protein OEV56_04455 [Dehalococcoidia bacterium]|nr:hypothetical protein [Dehalococcoidia bacterium]